jgi:hypothetical protein
VSPEAIELERLLTGFPGVRRVVATNKAFREVMLARDGQMFLNGCLWDVKSKPAGAGLRSVWLATRDDEGGRRG